MDIMEIVARVIFDAFVIGTVAAEVLKEINEHFKNHKQ